MEHGESANKRRDESSYNPVSDGDVVAFASSERDA
jgi:hypothetical protein